MEEDLRLEEDSPNNDLISTEELNEINRLSQKEPDKYQILLTTYKIIKKGKKGFAAIDEINTLLPEKLQIDKQKFDRILRIFRDKSKLLHMEIRNAIDKVNTEALKIQDKMDLIMKNGITKEKIEKASLKDTVFTYALLFDKLRLAQNKSTENIAIQGKLKDISGDKFILEMNKLRKDMQQLTEFAEENKIKLPDDKFVEKRMVKNGDIVTADTIYNDQNNLNENYDENDNDEEIEEKDLEEN